MTEQFTLAESAAKFVLTQTSLRPRVGLVLGSGLGGFADSLTEAARIPYAEIPAFPRSTAIGHAGQMVIGKAGSVPVAAMQGRVHLREGQSARPAARGHAGQMGIGKAGSVPVAAMQGRVHLYEGYSAQLVAFPMPVFGRMVT